MNDLSDNNVEDDNINNLLNTISNTDINIKLKPWNKHDNSNKIQRLHIFAEKYGNEKKFPVKQIKLLKVYFTDCILHKNKLQKSKDVNYDKDTDSIISIPGLNYNNGSKSFTIRITDQKRVSTLKSLTPKKFNSSNKNKEEI
jgi:hypothetical protein